MPELAKTIALLSQLGYAENDLGNQGHLLTKASIEQARWSDMFSGEEIGNATHLDLTRIQMFFFTIVALFCYASALGYMLNTAGSTGIVKFPELSQDLLVLIGISHAAYLTAKAVPHSKSGDQSVAGPIVEISGNDHPAVG